MDDEEEELALLRAQRKEKLGSVAGATLGERRRAAAAALPDDDDDDDDGPVVVDAQDFMSGELDEAMLAHFPLSFGKQEKVVAPISRAHEQTVRVDGRTAASPSIGPPRPPASAATGSAQTHRPPSNDAVIGPPRPSPPNGTGSAASTAAGSAMVGPPRPPAQSSQTSRPGERPAGAHEESLAGEAASTREAAPVVGPPRPNSNAVRDALGQEGGGGRGSGHPGASSGAAGVMMGPPRPPRPAQDSAQADAAGRAGPPEPAVVGPARPPASAQPGLMGPPKPQPASEGGRGARAAEAAASSRAGDGEEEEEEEDEEDEGPRFPVSNEIVLGGHTRLVSAVAVDPSGSRVLSGGFDYNLKMYDFNGMKSDLRPFRELQPHDGHPVNTLSFSPTGDAFLCVTGSSQAKVYDREGHERGEFKRGDMYMRDLKNTRGHVSGCCHGQWHPTDRHTAMTSSSDGTVRIWDTQAIEQKMVIKPSSKPGRVPVTACCYAHDGAAIAAALTDGTIQLWSVTGNFGRSAAVGVVAAPKQQMLAKQTWKYATGASQILKAAHPSDTEVTDLKFLRDGRSLLSRAADDTLKLWDVRRFKAPVHVWDGLPLSHSQTRICVSPLQDFVLTGVARDDDAKAGGALVILDLKSHALVRRLAMPGPVTSICWNAKINSILVGSGDRSHGATHVLYDPTMSEKGALLCVGKAVRAKDPFDFEPALIIHTPGALPLFRDDFSRKRKRGGVEKADPRIPDAGPSVSGPGGGGRMGTGTKTLLTHYLMEKQGLKMLKDQIDPREAMLRHKNAEAELAPWMSAYEKTQPKRIFAEPEEEEDK